MGGESSGGGRKFKSTEVVARILKGTHCARPHQMFTTLTTGQASAVLSSVAAPLRCSPAPAPVPCHTYISRTRFISTRLPPLTAGASPASTSRRPAGSGHRPAAITARGDACNATVRMRIDRSSERAIALGHHMPRLNAAWASAVTHRC